MIWCVHNMAEKIAYECGCTAGGDLVSAHCPIHGYPIIPVCRYVDDCNTCEMMGGFPDCYAPWEKDDKEQITCQLYKGLSTMRTYRVVPATQSCETR